MGRAREIAEERVESEAPQMPDVRDGIPGYDEWRLASDPDPGRRPRPSWADRMPEGSCGRRIGSLCDLPADHWLRKEPCNMNGWRR
jgi:hypothetical protein